MEQIVVKNYLGNNIEFKVIDGEIYIDATALGENQKLADWKRSKKTNELIQELEAMENSHRLIISENGKGTFIHESLFLDFAQYVNVKFKVWCQNQISTLIREGSVQLKPLSIEEMIIKQAQSMLEVKNDIDRLEKKFDTVVTLESGKQRKIQKAIANKVYSNRLFNSTCMTKYGDCEDYTEKEIIENKKRLARMLFANIYRDLKRKFGVASYKDIKVVDYEKALNFIENWIEDKDIY